MKYITRKHSLPTAFRWEIWYTWRCNKTGMAKSKCIAYVASRGEAKIIRDHFNSLLNQTGTVKS